MERKKITNQPNRFIKEKFEKLREEFGNKCHICNELYDLEFAHIKDTELSGRGRGRKERYYDIIKNKKSYKLLCSRCHELYDDGVIDLNGNKI